MLTEKDKLKVLADYVTQRASSLFIEELKLKFLHREALSSHEYAKVHDVAKGRVAALKAELEFMVEQLGTLKN